jgi:hypothetical protein
MAPALAAIAGGSLMRAKTVSQPPSPPEKNSAALGRAQLYSALSQSGLGAVVDETEVAPVGIPSLVANASVENVVEAIGFEFTSPTDLPILRVAPWRDPVSMVKIGAKPVVMAPVTINPKRIRTLRKELRDGEAAQAPECQEMLGTLARKTLQERYARRMLAMTTIESRESAFWCSPPGGPHAEARLFGVEFSSGLNAAWPVMTEVKDRKVRHSHSASTGYVELYSVSLDYAILELSKGIGSAIHFDTKFPTHKKVTVIGPRARSGDLVQSLMMLFDLQAKRSTSSIAFSQRSTERVLQLQRLKVQCFHRAERRSRELLSRLTPEQQQLLTRGGRIALGDLSGFPKQLLEEAVGSQIYGQAAVAKLLGDDPTLGANPVKVPVDPRAAVQLQADAESIPLTGL